VLREQFEADRRSIVRATLPSTSLRIKLALFAAALIVVPGLLFAVIVQQSERASLKGFIGRHLAREAEQTADRLEAILRSEREALRNFARQDLMREIRVDDIDKRVSLALATLRDGGLARIDYLVVNRTQRAIASSNPDFIGSIPDWGEASEAIRKHSEQPLGPIALGAPDVDALIIAAPIPDPDDGERTIGTLVGVYDWRRLTGVTETVQRELAAQGTHTRVVITARDGSVIGGAPLSPAEAAEFPSGWLSPIESRPDGESGYAVLPRAGFLIGYAAFGLGPAGWQLVIVERLADALAPVRQLTRRLGTILAVTLILALVLAAIGGRRVVKPLAELTTAIGGVSQGDLSSLRVAVRSEDEVGSLARALNQMAGELDRAQKDLVEAAQYARVGELAAGVAHEVRTTLGVVRSSTQILERSLPRDTDPQAVELAQLIREEVDRLGGIVNDLLELGRPRAPHLEAIEISVPLRRAIEMVESKATEKRVRLELMEGEALPAVRCDPQLLYQVALNLLVNAIQAVGEDGRVDVTTLRAADGSVGFEVRDDGPGIPDAIREKLFRPFATGREGGIGLGLTFVQRVVYEHQGRIRVESEPGRGACFRVELPGERTAT
jgi:signal transduction histidine kinase